MRLGGQLALAGKLRPGHHAAVETHGDGGHIERQHELRRALLAEIADRGQLKVEIDRLSLPVELALAGRGLCQGRQAEIRRDMLDVLLGAFLVVDDIHGAILDAHIAQAHVALRRFAAFGSFATL